MLLLKDFNRRFTLRRLSMFGAPVVLPMASMTFPKNSVLHNFQPDALEIGPPGTLYHLSESERPPRIRHHLTLPEEGTIGLPIEIKINLHEPILLYQRKWSTIGKFRSLDLVTGDPKIIMIENYSILLKRWRYNERINLWYDIAHNQLNAVLDGIDRSIIDFPERQHYLPITLSSNLPGKQKLDKMIKSKTRAVWGDIGSYGMLSLVELYAWVGSTEQRATSLFNRFSDRELKHINIMFEFKGNFVNINLGELDGWRREGKVGKVDPRDMQKRLRETIRTILESPTIIDKGPITPQEGVDLPTEDTHTSIDIVETEDDIQAEIDSFNERTATIDEEEDVIIEDVVVDHDDDYNDDTDLIAIMRKELNAIKYLSPKRYEKFKDKFDMVGSLESPYGGSYSNMLVMSEEDMKIPKRDIIPGDKRFTIPSWNRSTTKEYGRKYCTEILKKDIVRMCYGAQKLGFIIDNHDMEELLTVSGHSEKHKLSVTLTQDGRTATLPFTMPVVDPDGYWKSNGVKYTMRKQRVDLPIRKTGPTTVALTTFYGKCFINVTEKMVANWAQWCYKHIRLMSNDNDNMTMSNASYSNVFDHDVQLPREYSMIAMEVDSFDSLGYHYNFDHKKIPNIFKEEEIELLKSEDLTPVAKSRSSILAMDMSSAMYVLKDGSITPTDKLAKLIGLPMEKEPKEYTEVNVLGKDIALGIMLCYYWGIEKLLRATKTKYEFIPPGGKVTGEGIVLQLAEGRLEIQPTSHYEELIYNCFLRYKDQLKSLTLRDLNSPNATPILLAKDKLGNEYITEMKQMGVAFVDPFHEDILRKMGEPTGFKGLLLRANELMDLPHHPLETAISQQNLLTHQRFAGHLYKEMVMAMRRYNNAPPSTRKFELKPRAVNSAINSDTSVLGAQEAGPIQSIKEADVCTFGGSGGRARLSMTRHTRIFNKEDLGIISGDTVDSTDVGITALLSNDANISDMYGNVTVTDDVNKLEHGQLLSFCNSIAPDVDTDDSKRGNFVGIQMGSAQSAKDGICPPYRTPSASLVAHRASDSYAVGARQDGKVTEVSGFGVSVTYEDGTVSSYPLGRWYGSYEGGTYPHDMVTNLKVGDKFTDGTILTYASNHFETDIANPSQVVWKAGVMAWVGLINANEVYEDSNQISYNLSNKLEFPGTKIKDALFSFDENIMTILSMGSKVDYDTILAIIDDTNDFEGYSNEAIVAMSEISSKSPKADVKGYLDRIEVIYNGEYEEMSDSVMQLARKGDRQRRTYAKNSPTPQPLTGQVTEEYKVGGNPLKRGQMLVRFYITHNTTPGGGGKIVLANQMKSVILGMMVGKNYSEDGDELDLLFGREGVDNRIVGSLYHIGLKNTFCYEVGKECRELRDS